MEQSGFEETGIYITRRQNTVAQYITMQPILDLYEQSVWRTGYWVSWRWCEQEGIYLEGSKKRAAEDSDREEYKCGEEAV